MAHLLVGAVAGAAFVLVVQLIRRRREGLAWWGWLLTLLGLLYAVFALEVVIGFLEEGTAKGAMVMGTMLGVVAVVWGVLLGRFVLARPRETEDAEGCRRHGG